MLWDVKPLYLIILTLNDGATRGLHYFVKWLQFSFLSVLKVSLCLVWGLERAGPRLGFVRPHFFESESPAMRGCTRELFISEYLKVLVEVFQLWHFKLLPIVSASPRSKKLLRLVKIRKYIKFKGRIRRTRTSSSFVHFIITAIATNWLWTSYEIIQRVR